jgi:hypothetical protein
VVAIRKGFQKCRGGYFIHKDDDYTVNRSAYDDLNRSQIPDCLSRSNAHGDHITVHWEHINLTTYYNNSLGKLNTLAQPLFFSNDIH